MNDIRTDFLQSHLELLEEWNEDTIFSAETTSIMVTDRATTVTQDVREMAKDYNDDGIFTGLKQTGIVHVIAIYGDEDELKKLIVVPNTRKPEVLIDRTIRG